MQNDIKMKARKIFCFAGLFWPSAAYGLWPMAYGKSVRGARSSRRVCFQLLALSFQLLLSGRFRREKMEARGEMDDFACETGRLQDVIDGAGDVERHRTDFGGRGLDETIHLF